MSRSNYQTNDIPKEDTMNISRNTIVRRALAALATVAAAAAMLGGAEPQAHAWNDTMTCYPRDGGRPFTCGPVSAGYHCSWDGNSCVH